jgi:hypothetical protein
VSFLFSLSLSLSLSLGLTWSLPHIVSVRFPD